MKRYNYRATTRNIPNLYLYTKIIGLSFLSIGINCLITFFYLRFAVESEYSILMLMLGVVMLVLAPIAMIDDRKEMRDSLYTVLSVVLLFVCTVGDVILFKFFWLLIPLAVELSVIVIIAIKCKKKRLNNSRRRENDLQKKHN